MATASSAFPPPAEAARGPGARRFQPLPPLIPAIALLCNHTPPEQRLFGGRVGHELGVQGKQRPRLRQLARQQRRKGGLVQPHLGALRGGGRAGGGGRRSEAAAQLGIPDRTGRPCSLSPVELCRARCRPQLAKLCKPAHERRVHRQTRRTPTCSGGMRQSARKPSGVSTGRGVSGGSSAARRTASTCAARAKVQRKERSSGQRGNFY